MKIKIFGHPYDTNDTLYGDFQRRVFMEEIIHPLAQKKEDLRVLDFGCGTGEGLSFPLARQFPSHIRITGVDSDAASISQAQNRARDDGMTHIDFVHSSLDSLPPSISEEAWDVVILSEVMEHFADPKPLLSLVNRLLRPDGTLLLTLPNGTGCFEIESFLWKLLRLDALDRFLLRSFKKDTSPSSAPVFTFASTNTHAAFYTWGHIKSLLKASGFEIRSARNRELISGPFSHKLDYYLRRFHLSAILIAPSQILATILPRALASDWMVAAQRTGDFDPQKLPTIPRHPFSRWWWRAKRRLNSP